jgi:hypothetical protein
VGSFGNADKQPKPTPGDYAELLKEIEDIKNSGGGSSGDGCGITVVDDLDLEKEYGAKEVPSMNNFADKLSILSEISASLMDVEKLKAKDIELSDKIDKNKTDITQYVISELSRKQNNLVDTASVGQTVRVKDVDANGKPIDWEPVDFPVGGSSEEWEHICDIPVVEDTENPLFKITQSLGADYKTLHIVVNKNTAGGLVATATDSYPLKIYGNSHHNNNLIGQFGADVTSSGYSFYSCEFDYNKYTNLITGWSSICPKSHWKTINGNIRKPIHTLVFVNNAKSGATAGFYTFTIKVWGVRA